MCKKEYGEPRERPENDDLAAGQGDTTINYHLYSGANDNDRWAVLMQPTRAAGGQTVYLEPVSEDDIMDPITLARTVTGLYRDGYDPNTILFPEDSPVHLAAKWLWDHGPHNRI